MVNYGNKHFVKKSISDRKYREGYHDSVQFVSKRLMPVCLLWVISYIFSLYLNLSYLALSGLIIHHI